MPWLYLGDVSHVTYANLQKHGFTALLNISCIQTSSTLPPIIYKQIAVMDDADADLKTWFPETVAFIGNYFIYLLFLIVEHSNKATLSMFSSPGNEMLEIEKAKD